MSWRKVSWEVPLAQPPEIVALSKNVHGFDPVDVYCLPHLWSLHLYAYEGELKVGPHELPIRPGHLGLTPAGKVTEFHYRGISTHIYAHFRFPASEEPSQRLPAMIDLGDRYEETYQRLAAAVGADPRRQSALVWDLLWEMSEAASSDANPSGPHPAVRIAVEAIEGRLTEPLSVAELAREACVSYSYLARLFQEEFGESVVAYIRRRRVERATHLLTRSTLPIKSIGPAVGISDLQRFNKLIRQETGLSPRQLRKSRLV